MNMLRCIFTQTHSYDVYMCARMRTCVCMLMCVCDFCVYVCVRDYVCLYVTKLLCLRICSKAFAYVLAFSLSFTSPTVVEIVLFVLELSKFANF